MLDRVGTVVVGRWTAAASRPGRILAGGHVLFEDVPGLGKTLAARSLAAALGLEFRRLQCTPDLLPADITGSYVYDPADAVFFFRPGPVFTGLLLADEINRTAPKTQSALLEAMAERQVTVEGTELRAAAAVPRDGDVEPGRVRGHLSAAGGPARPLHGPAGGRLSGSDGGGGSCSPASSAGARRPRSRRSSTPHGAARCRPGSRPSTWSPTSRNYCVRSPPAPAPIQASRSVPRPGDRWRCCWWLGRSPCWPGGTSSLPEDVKEIAVAALAHRITLNPDLGERRAGSGDRDRDRRRRRWAAHRR